jgi:hypothetical protein
MFTARIAAENAVLFIDEVSATTEITYRSDRPVAIWYRHNLYVWIRLVLDRTGIRPQLDRCGAFRSPEMLPGDILEYRLYQDMQHNPSDGARNKAGQLVPYDSVTLLGLRRRPFTARRPSYTFGEWSGAGWRCRVGMPGLISHLAIEAAREAPVTGPSGALGFKAPDFSLLSLNRPIHQLDLKPLLPATDYHVVLRYSDSAGNWWCENGSFATPSRPVRTATLSGASRLRALPSNY